MNCSRCKKPMIVCTTRYINALPNPDDRERFESIQNKWNGKKIFHCGSCGRLSYRSAGKVVVIPSVIRPSPESFSIKLLDDGNTNPADLNELLKLNPGKSVLRDVIEKVGRPFARHTLNTGLLLCYQSDDPNNPHSVLIDSLYSVVKLVAIHNDNEAFDLDNLGEAYGEQEFVTRTDGFEFWIYEAHGVAKVTEGFSDEAILFVQFFEKRLDMNRYMEMNCFFEETFYSG